MRLRPAGGNQRTHIGCGTESLPVCFPLDPKVSNFDQLETFSISVIIAYVFCLVSRPWSSSSGWWISGLEAEATSWPTLAGGQVPWFPMDPVLIGTLPDTAAIVSCWRAEKQKHFKACYPNELPNTNNLLYLYAGMSQQISRLGVLPFYPIQIISCKQMLSDSLNMVKPERPDRATGL